MNTTKNKQITGLVLGAVSFLLPNVSSAIANSAKDAEAAIGAIIAAIVIYLICLVCGIIGIIMSSGASKEAKLAGEPKVIATIGLIVSIVGTAYAGIGLFACGVCACVGAAAISQAGNAASKLL